MYEALKPSLVNKVLAAVAGVSGASSHAFAS